MTNHRHTISLWIISLVSVCIIYYSNESGLWFVTFGVGLLYGLLPLRTRYVFPFIALISALGWVLPLLWMGLSQNLHTAASIIAAVMGFGTSLWWITDLFTLITGLLLGLSGAWLSTAAVNLLRAGKTQTSSTAGAAGAAGALDANASYLDMHAHGPGTGIPAQAAVPREAAIEYAIEPSTSAAPSPDVHG